VGKDTNTLDVSAPFPGDPKREALARRRQSAEQVVIAKWAEWGPLKMA
jgi:hypothetical protein